MTSTVNDSENTVSVTPRLGFAKAAIVAGLRVLSVLVGLAYVKYYTNALTVEQVGEFLYLGTLSYVLNALVFVPVDSYMQARLSALDTLPIRALRRLGMTTLLVALALCVLLSTPFVAMDLLALEDVPLLFGLASLLYLCSSVRNLLNIRGQATFAASMILLESVARLLAFVVAIIIMGATARTLLASSIAALVAELAFLLWQAGRSLPLSKQTGQLDSLAHVLRTTTALSGGAVSNTVQLQAYRILFPVSGHSHTSATLGVTANIGAVAMSACAQVFSQLFLPRLYQTRGASINEYVIWSGILATGLLAVSLPMSEFLVRYLTSPEYVAYAPIVGVGVVIEACNMLVGAYSVYLTLHHRTIILFYAQMLAAIVSLFGCLLLLTKSPESPMLVGLVISSSHILLVLALGIYVCSLTRKANTASFH